MLIKNCENINKNLKKKLPNKKRAENKRFSYKIKLSEFSFKITKKEKKIKIL